MDFQTDIKRYEKSMETRHKKRERKSRLQGRVRKYEKEVGVKKKTETNSDKERQTRILILVYKIYILS